MSVRLQPFDPFREQVVAGSVVDDEEDLATCRTDELLQELEERVAAPGDSQRQPKRRPA